MGYFKTIIAMAGAGCVTAFGSVIATMSTAAQHSPGAEP
jgi:hypothetical protein